MSKLLVLNPFTLDSDSHSFNHGLKCEDVSLTVQSDAEEADINTIVRKFGITHQLPYGNQVPAYIDYSDIPNDYHAAMNFIRDSDSHFMDLPSNLRSRFDNDAGKFLEFVSNSANREEAVKLGLVPPLSSADGSSPPLDSEPPVDA